MPLHFATALTTKLTRLPKSKLFNKANPKWHQQILELGILMLLLGDQMEETNSQKAVCTSFGEVPL